MSYGIRREFYNSKAWQDVRKTVWLRQNLLCNRCHKPVYVDGISEYIPKGQRRTGIVHHKIYPPVFLNFLLHQNNNYF